MHKELFIIAGANGSGKTTLARELLKEFSLEFVNADEIAGTINPNNIQEVRVQAGKLVFKKLDELLLREKSFAIETTLSGNFLVKTIKQSQEKGYNTTLIYSFVDNPGICIERIKVRVNNGGHFVPDEDVIRRYYRSKRNLWFKYRYVVDKWTVFYNGLEEFINVMEGDKQTVEIRNERLYNLFMESLDND
ncbi:MAG: AAA family ATPase [Candidatus Gastranaerophilales bacterium]|nr:AAA family ATPase [Candidatus Gastranaerophilales bacterium]